MNDSPVVRESWIATRGKPFVVSGVIAFFIAPYYVGGHFHYPAFYSLIIGIDFCCMNGAGMAILVTLMPILICWSLLYRFSIFLLF
jgi:hypothetical protein